MMEHILNQMRQEAARAVSGRMHVTLAMVKSYDPNNYAVKALLWPEELETGWLPVASAWVGNQWGLFLPPAIGDMVAVYFIEGALEAGFVGPAFFNVQQRPLTVPNGEAWLVHQSGSFLKLRNDGSVEVNATAGLNVTGNVNVTGQVTATGNVRSSGGEVIDKKSSMDTMRTTYNTHTHTDPQGGVTGVPNAPMT